MKYKRFLRAIDESDISNLALQESIELTKVQKATLRIISVGDETVVKCTESYIAFEALWNAYKEGRDLLACERQSIKMMINM